MGKGNLHERQKEIEELVLLAQKGDQMAFSKLYDIFIDPIYKYVFYRVDRDDSEDITENVFLKVWENLRKYKSGNSSFTAWIFRITHNLVIDYYRSSKDRDVSELDVQIPDTKRAHNPIKTTEEGIDQAILKKALRKLKKKYQEILVYKFINDFSNVEISEILKKTEGSIRILQFRALKALKRELKEMGVDRHL